MRIRDEYLRRKYGTTLLELEALLAEQDNRCGICHRPWYECPPAKRARFDQGLFLHHLCVDHDHGTGRIRGLLCNSCNTTLGLMEEREDWFYEAIAYLNRHAIIRGPVQSNVDAEVREPPRKGIEEFLPLFSQVSN